jgi:hypothetical protein
MIRKLIDDILPRLVSGDSNKKECAEDILAHFSSSYKLHSNLKNGDKIIYQGNSGILLKKGDIKSLIKWERLGYMNTEKDEEVYNIEFYKEPKNHWA